MAPPPPPAAAAAAEEEEFMRDTMSTSRNDENKTVCVMDAAGQLGSALVRRLLHLGYAVHAALQHPGEMQTLKREYGENKRLKVFHADPLDYHSIVDALKGCCSLFYSFEPPFEYPAYDEHMGEVEVRAAHNVLEACAQTDSILKVIFTSSVTAVVWRDHSSNHAAPHDSCDIDERNWSDVNFCRKFKLWHALSKTLAEKTAWALAMDRGVSMVSINGGLLITPSDQQQQQQQQQQLPPYLKGAAEMYEDGVLVTVDLGFLIDAHICIFEDVSSYGRYLCFNHVINSPESALELATLLMPTSPSSPPPSVEDTKVYPQRISNKKLNKLLVNSETQLQLHQSESVL